MIHRRVCVCASSRQYFWCGSLLPTFDFLTFVHYTFISVCVAEGPLLGERAAYLVSRVFALCFVCLWLFPVLILKQCLVFDCSGSCLLQPCYFITQTCSCNILQYFMVVKMVIFRWKKWYFPYFCSKHRSWVHVRTATLRRF